MARAGPLILVVIFLVGFAVTLGFGIDFCTKETYAVGVPHIGAAVTLLVAFVNDPISLRIATLKK